jgi:hypothetical protein
VTAAPASGVVFATPAQPLLTVGKPSGPVTVQLEDAFGNVAQAPSGGLTFSLKSSSTAGVFQSGGQSASAIAIPAGSSTASFTYEDSDA